MKNGTTSCQFSTDCVGIPSGPGQKDPVQASTDSAGTCLSADVTANLYGNWSIGRVTQERKEDSNMAIFMLFLMAFVAAGLCLAVYVAARLVIKEIRQRQKKS